MATSKEDVKKNSAPKNKRAGKNGKSVNEKATKKVEGKKTRSAEIKGIIFIALGIFLALSFFTEMMGAVGEVASNLMKGLFGGASAIFFVFVIWTGLNMFVEEKIEKVTYKMWLLLAVMVVISLTGALWQSDMMLSADAAPPKACSIM